MNAFLKQCTPLSLYFSFICLFILFFPGVANAKPTITFALPNPPSTMVKDSSIQLKHVEYRRRVIEEIAEELNININVIRVPGQRVLFMLKNGTADFTAGFYKSESREQYMQFSSVPLYSDEIVMVSHKNSHFTWDGNFKKFHSQRSDIALVRDGEYGPNLKKSESSSLNFIYLPTTLTAFEFLKRERVGALATSFRDVEFFTDHLDMKRDIVVHEIPIHTTPRFIAKSRVSEVELTIADIDSVLSYMKINGSLKALREEFGIDLSELATSKAEESKP